MKRSCPVDPDTLMTEKDFQWRIRDYAEGRLWTVLTTTDSRHSPDGDPDLRMIRPPRVVYAEVKRVGGKLTDAQIIILTLVSECPPIEPYAWWPEDWEAIKAILK